MLSPPPEEKRVGLCFLRLGLFYLRFVFVAYGNLVWSFLLAVEILFGLFCLRWRLGVVFLLTLPPPSGNWIGSFSLTVPPP